MVYCLITHLFRFAVVIIRFHNFEKFALVLLCALVKELFTD